MNRRYEILLFDADDTLLDFRKNEYEALRVVFKAMQYQFNKRTYMLYRQINHMLWEQYEKGKITRETVLNSRFSLLFEQLGVTVNGAKVEALYRHELGTGAHVIDGALEICRELADLYNLYVVTNGVYETQVIRLKASGLSAYMQNIFVSDTIGYQKPSYAFFSHVFEFIPRTPLTRILIIGDSLSSDIQGGLNAGIDTCWFNPSKQPKQANINPTYEISSLHELPLLLCMLDNC